MVLLQFQDIGRTNYENKESTLFSEYLLVEVLLYMLVKEDLTRAAAKQSHFGRFD